jgi:hypothetical protein
LDNVHRRDIQNYQFSALWAAYSAKAPESVRQSYFLAKEISARQRLKIELQTTDIGHGDEAIKVRVVYRYPFMFPFLGVVLGAEDGPTYQATMTCDVTLPEELPRNPGRQLGIVYD